MKQYRNNCWCKLSFIDVGMPNGLTTLEDDFIVSYKSRDFYHEV